MRQQILTSTDRSARLMSKATLTAVRWCLNPCTLASDVFVFTQLFNLSLSLRLVTRGAQDSLETAAGIIQPYYKIKMGGCCLLGAITHCTAKINLSSHQANSALIHPNPCSPFTCQAQMVHPFCQRSPWPGLKREWVNSSPKMKTCSSCVRQIMQNQLTKDKGCINCCQWLKMCHWIWMISTSVPGSST